MMYLSKIHHIRIIMNLSVIISGLAVAVATLSGQILQPTEGMVSLMNYDIKILSEDFEENPNMQPPKVELLQYGNYTFYITDKENEEISITKISNPEENLVIPAMIDGYQVTGVGMLFDSFAYYEENGYPVEEYRIIRNEEMDKIKSISFPEGLEQIGTNAFYGMKALEEITLPDSLLMILPGSFLSCGIKELTLPKNLSYISNHSFYNCKSLSKINIQSKNLNYSDEYPPFAGCEALEDVIWESTVENINLMGFRLNHINRMVVPETVKAIDLQVIDTLIIKGMKTELNCLDAYVRENLKNIKIILPKNSAAIKGAKELNCKYIEVSLPKAPVISKKLYIENNTNKIRLSWGKVPGASKYQVYYAKTKIGTYSKIAEIGKLSYSLAKKSGFIKIRAYKIYQGEKWYGPYATIKLN